MNAVGPNFGAIKIVRAELSDIQGIPFPFVPAVERGYYFVSTDPRSDQEAKQLDALYYESSASNMSRFGGDWITLSEFDALARHSPAGGPKASAKQQSTPMDVMRAMFSMKRPSWGAPGVGGHGSSNKKRKRMVAEMNHPKPKKQKRFHRLF